MTETLTAEDIKTLKRPFAAKHHEFLNGLAYIGEALVTARIEEVDPAWQFEITSVNRSNDIVTVQARLRIKNVTRDNVGMAKVIASKSGSEANEAEKSAATDALKRCARLFGIGRYLLTLPDNVKDTASLERWLAPYFAQDSSAAPQSQSTPSNGQKQSTTSVPVWWNKVIDTVKALPHFAGQPKHVMNALNKMLAAREIAANWSAGQVIEAVKKKYDADEAPAIDYSNEDIPF